MSAANRISACLLQLWLLVSDGDAEQLAFKTRACHTEVDGADKGLDVRRYIDVGVAGHKIQLKLLAKVDELVANVDYVSGALHAARLRCRYLYFCVLVKQVK